MDCFLKNFVCFFALAYNRRVNLYIRYALLTLYRRHKSILQNAGPDVPLRRMLDRGPL